MIIFIFSCRYMELALIMYLCENDYYARFMINPFDINCYLKIRQTLFLKYSILYPDLKQIKKSLFLPCKSRRKWNPHLLRNISSQYLQSFPSFPGNEKNFESNVVQISRFDVPMILFSLLNSGVKSMSHYHPLK